MYKKYLLLIFAVAFSTMIYAQLSFSYVSDRKFRTVTDLFGYAFRPNEMVIKDELQRDLSYGSYSFGITPANLFVEGENIQGVYTINNINPTEYGFQLVLMNARDPTLQGHLKVILNNLSQVDALIFKRSPKEKEIVFYQAIIPDELRKKEEAYFTDRNELLLPATDSLWTGLTFRPFLRMHGTERIQERLQMNDSTSVTFFEVVRIIDKTKKKNTQTVDTAIVISDTLTTDSAAVAPVENEKIKIIREHFVKYRSIQEYEDGKKEDKTWEFQIVSENEKESKSESSTEDRFQITLKTTKGEELLLFLNNKRMVTVMQIGDKRLMARGY
jgi:hypothetical protein